MVGVGAAVSMTKVLLLLPVLPAVSVWVTWAVYWALAGRAAALAVQVPLPAARLLKVWSAGPVGVGPA